MNFSPNLILGLIMFLAGIGIPIMAALNSGLGSRLANPVQAATLLFGLALVISCLALAAQPNPISMNLRSIPPPYFLGGVFVAFYVLSITYIAPKIGVGNAIVLVLLGQLIASSLIDHFGWFGAPQVSISGPRAMGLLLIAGGVLLARPAAAGQ